MPVIARRLLCVFTVLISIDIKLMVASEVGHDITFHRIVSGAERAPFTSTTQCVTDLECKWFHTYVVEGSIRSEVTSTTASFTPNNFGEYRYLTATTNGQPASTLQVVYVYNIVGEH